MEDEVGRVSWGYIVFECQASTFGFYPKDSGESLMWNGMIKVFIKESLIVMWAEWIGGIGWFGAGQDLKASSLNVSKSLLNQGDGHGMARKVQMQD